MVSRIQFYQFKVLKKPFYQFKVLRIPFYQFRVSSIPFYQFKVSRIPFYQIKVSRTPFYQFKVSRKSFYIGNCHLCIEDLLKLRFNSFNVIISSAYNLCRRKSWLVLSHIWNMSFMKYLNKIYGELDFLIEYIVNLPVNSGSTVYI